MSRVIELEIKEKKFKNESLSSLENFKLEVNEGEKIAIIGESGVGKSTLLNIIGLLDGDFSGEYNIFGLSRKEMCDKELASFRNNKIGFVLQESALIDTLSIEENIKLPLCYADNEQKQFTLQDFEKITKAIRIENILKKKPLGCSGGERARAVLARGLIMKPKIILADEPTASLDEDNKERIVELLFKMNKKYNTTIITVTHDLEVAKRHDRIIKLERR
ncbi:ABC transporter ATP-binding protein [Lachnobacterium bovis]|uniref:Putative ABC transport system ATP-binding protein n=2 Tax=Lachnobacterium bovis TaxID=140626 RepID=A0A1H3JHJ1_9FIRM|nr:ATP-binding cassette domain-containing protein [Lachnobacterium bovis]SDY39480.1 putative ABC transport system ATP-binding protein [Lachnobacterium bovis DSM 14045]SES10225.1 putative ABC transport system ATP-binding protein [Lachnobacterium bovis]